MLKRIVLWVLFKVQMLKYHIKAFIEHWIPVMDQIAFAQQESVLHITHIPGNLCCPVAVRIMGNSTASDLA